MFNDTHYRIPSEVKQRDVLLTYEHSLYLKHSSKDGSTDTSLQ